MRLTVLGRWSPYPIPGEACSGYYLEVGGLKMLLECGNGVVSNLHKYSFSWDLDFAVTTHLHADHCGDIPLLRAALNVGMLYNYCSERLPFYITKEPVEKFEQFRGCEDGLDFRFIEDIEVIEKDNFSVRTVKIEEVEIEFMAAEHSIPSYAVSVIKDSKKFVYSSDTQYIPELEAFAYKADLFLCEATVVEENRDYAEGRHLTPRQAGELARKAEVKNLLVTHFFPEYDIVQIQKEVSRGFGCNSFKVAVQEESYKI